MKSIFENEKSGMFRGKMETRMVRGLREGQGVRWWWIAEEMKTTLVRVGCPSTDGGHWWQWGAGGEFWWDTPPMALETEAWRWLSAV